MKFESDNNIYYIYSEIIKVAMKRLEVTCKIRPVVDYTKRQQYEYNFPVR